MFGGRRKADIDNILIVEDEALVAFDNEHVLSDNGYHVVATVDSVEAATRVLANQTVGLVLTDVSLRGEGTGYDVAAAAKTRGVPVLFVSGSELAGERHGAVGRLGKPYNDRDLLAAIDAAADRLAGRVAKRPPAQLVLFDD